MQKFDIYFMLEGKDYALRVWPFVPRIGERVMFHMMGGPISFKVVDVLWGVAPDDRNGVITVNVGLERLTPLPEAGHD